MASQIFTNLDESEFKTLLASCIAETVQSELAKVLTINAPRKTIFTRQETAELLNISLPTLHDYTKRGIITSYRLGFKIRYRLEDIEKALLPIRNVA